MSDRVVVLTGGVGGAKLLLGLNHVVSSNEITAIVNTADDFRHLGFWISPDIDTVLYTLSGQSNEVQGWGRANETWTFMTVLKSLGGEDWFALGDGDLALHAERTRRLAAGEDLSSITASFASLFGIASEILPMSDSSVSTCLETDEGELPFQRYFVERRCVPRVRAIRFVGADAARAPERVAEVLADRDTRAILIAPSNPYLSIDPILAIPAIRAALHAARAPRVAVSPLVGGQAVKGPTRKIMDELGREATPRSLADHYVGLIDGILIDERDRGARPPDITHAYADTLMRSLGDRIRVARAALDLCQRINGRHDGQSACQTMGCAKSTPDD